MIENPKVLLIETTHRCQAKCPDCQRTRWIEEDIGFHDKQDLPLQAIKNIASSNVVRQVDFVKFSGNFGDAMFNPHIKEFVQMLGEVGVSVKIETNGSVRTPEYFAELGKLDNLEILFAIDGLADTHSKYRVNTHFDKIMANARAFIDAGGKASCNTIAFPWIINQLDDIKQLVMNMGFQDFTLKNPRGSSNTGHLTKLIATDMDVNWKGKCSGNSFCPSIRKQRLVIDAYGNLQPCTYASVEYEEAAMGIGSNSFEELFPFDKSIVNNNLDDVYEEYMKRADHILTAMEAGIIPICNKTCYNPNLIGNY